MGQAPALTLSQTDGPAVDAAKGTAACWGIFAHLRRERRVGANIEMSYFGCTGDSGPVGSVGSRSPGYLAGFLQSQALVN
jgi:hypothetical protein